MGPNPLMVVYVDPLGLVVGHLRRHASDGMPQTACLRRHLEGQGDYRLGFRVWGLGFRG